MTTHHELDRSISVWLEAEAPDRAPDDVLEASRDRIRNTRQRREWIPARRFEDVNAYAKVGLAAAAVVAVAVLGYQLLPGIGGPGGPPTVSPTPRASPSIGPSSEPSITATRQTIAPFEPCPSAEPDCVSDPSAESITITYDLPTTWERFEGDGPPWVDENGPPDGASVWFYRGSQLDLHSDPCRPINDEEPPDITVGPTVDGFVTALADHPLLDVTTPVDVTLDGYSGKYVDLTVPDDISECDTYRPIATAHIYAQGPSQRWHMWVLDVDGVTIVVETNDFPGTSAQRRGEIQAIVNSIDITP